MSITELNVNYCDLGRPRLSITRIRKHRPSYWHAYPCHTCP